MSSTHLLCLVILESPVECAGTLPILLPVDQLAVINKF